MVLQPTRCTVRKRIATFAVGSYPAFSPFLPSRPGRRSFSVTLAIPSRGILPLGCAALCVARTFLPSRFTNRSEFRFSGAAGEPPCYADGKGNHSCDNLPWPGIIRPSAENISFGNSGFPKAMVPIPCSTLGHNRPPSRAIRQSLRRTGNDPANCHYDGISNGIQTPLCLSRAFRTRRCRTGYFRS